MFSEGRELIEKELDIVYLVRKLRFFELAINEHLNIPSEKVEALKQRTNFTAIESASDVRKHQYEE